MTYLSAYGRTYYYYGTYSLNKYNELRRKVKYLRSIGRKTFIRKIIKKLSLFGTRNEEIKYELYVTRR